MSKATLVGLVKGLARDLGPRGITINNVQPGPIDTLLCAQSVGINRACGLYNRRMNPHAGVARYDMLVACGHETAMFSGRTIDSLGPLHLAREGASRLIVAVR
jgi:enoyl-[acyl-carrier-protein] reductase (NADH)